MLSLPKSIGLLLCLTASLFAESVKIKQTVGSVIQTKGKIQTSSSSRIELELPYLATVRIGSNADFKFSSDGRDLKLGKGTLLFSSPKGSGDVIIAAGSVATAITNGGSLEMSNVGGSTKVIVLEGKIVSSLIKNPSESKKLKYGQMIDVPAGATTMPPVTNIKLSTLLKTSILFNMGPFPGQRAIKQNATKQAPPRPFITGGFDPDWGSGQANLLSSIGPAGTAAMIARMEANASPPLPSLAANAIPTQNQIVTFEAAGVPIPKSNIRAIQRSDVIRIIEGKRIQKPQPPIVVQPQPTRPPVVVQPTPQPTRPPIIRPPIATPRPTIRPPIAPP